MNDWLHNLPIVWMAVVVFGGTFLVSAAIYAAVLTVAAGEWARAFKAVSPGMLPPLGILFGLFVAFIAAQVWTDIDRASTAVNREASALSVVLFMASSFPGDTETRMRGLVHDYIDEAVSQEWPQMAQREAHLRVTPRPLAEALKTVFALTLSTRSQETAQQEITTALENALDARRQRIIVSRSEVNLVKWSCLLVQAICMLIAIAMVHSDNRRTAAITMVLYAAGAAVAVLLILAHDRPFAGEVSIGPSPLLHVMREVEMSQK
jgi:Protein of unknown function (DUF4239)